MVASRLLANPVAARWDIPRYGLLYIAIYLAVKGAWSMAVSPLVSGVEFHAIFGPHLIMDLRYTYVHIYIFIYVYIYVYMYIHMYTGESWAWRGWTMRTVS